VFVALLSLFLSPWAIERSNEYRRQMEKRDDLSRVSPGVFREAADAERVFFVEAGPGEETSVQNVFISSLRGEEVGVMVSKRGFRETAENGDRYIVLLDGRQYQGRPGRTDFQIMYFERYALRVKSSQAKADQVSSKAMSSLALIRDPSNANLGELLWRVGLPLSALTLALLAIPLSFVNPRASRSINLVFALLTYMVYSNLISIAQAWVSQGRLSFSIGWWIVHASMMTILCGMFWRRMRVGRVVGR
jgi:lipopolysaccharide export system permease protein